MSSEKKAVTPVYQEGHYHYKGCCNDNAALYQQQGCACQGIIDTHNGTLLAQSKASAGRTRKTRGTTAGSGPLSDLVLVCQEALDVMCPMIRGFYHAITGETAKLKADKSVFTIADGIVQHLLLEVLFKGDKFKAVVGEEDAKVNLVNRPYTVDELKVPCLFEDLIDRVRQQVGQLAAKIDSKLYQDYTAFVDPIDGTREFSTGKGEQCTVLVGFADKQGVSRAGVVYRPIPEPAVWAAGCASEHCRLGNLQPASAPLDPPVLVTTNGSTSSWMQALLEAGMTQVKSGGAGNKSLMLLEGRASAYIQDRGVSRWDTCGPEAVLEAWGGSLMKLNAFAGHSATCSKKYCYLESEANRDFVKGEAALTPYNASGVKPVKKGEKVTADNVVDVKPYANLCGLFALAGSELSRLAFFEKLIKQASKTVPPSFD